MKRAAFLLSILTVVGCKKAEKPRRDVFTSSTPVVWTGSTITVAEATFKTKPPVLSPPKDHPPLTVIVGAYTYHVRFTTHAYLRLNDCAAFTNKETKEIWLGKESPELREEMLHEVMHATLAGHGEHAFLFPTEDVFITPMSPELLETLRDNPELVKWLVKE